MKRAMKLILAVGLLSAASFFGGKTLAERVARPVPSCSLDCLSGHLRLTPEQRRQCAASDSGFEQRRNKLMKTLADRRAKLIELLRAPTSNRKQIDEALAAVATAQAALQRAVVDHLLRLKTFLTRKQQEELFDMLGQHMCSAMGLGTERPGACKLRKRNTGESQ